MMIKYFICEEFLLKEASNNAGFPKPDIILEPGFSYQHDLSWRHMSRQCALIIYDHVVVGGGDIADSVT